ncbi:hypothetical protein BU14_0272s0006 [Porphyra umbilicalis]|uniref:Photosystem II reaction center M protein n=1 Tax=Porphyra umbilicalis TaxID=2786 RepID=A0A1X6P1E3_PORUM|nr:hypothetical protein BU14_0272s0006 [Porphyra umbilicalis]|eukprot:OSX74688.1 hypothetical protein BU14_0272s0006 [Porphyra umbilicalis]
MYAFVPATGVAALRPSLAAVSQRSFTGATAPVAVRARRARVTPTASVEPLATVPLPSSLLLADGMSVTFPAYLAIFLGTLIPVAFLIILYIQAESRKAGENSVRND